MNKPPLNKIPREQIPKGANLCEYCSAKCCRYFALQMDTPKSHDDFDLVRWFLLHERASVFIEDDAWYLLVHSVCKKLLPDNRCGVYHTRPKICQDYKTDDCEYEDDYTYDGYFEIADQVQEYMDARFNNRPDGSHFRSPRPILFPILD